jgi:bifunctional DNA-binding transcriptional regulator/antitoxin component of YhaV-PrlF toxin-antitoxin module
MSNGVFRTVIKLGSGFVIYLTKELKQLGLKPKDRVWIYRDNDRIFISKDKNAIFKPIGVSEEIWKDFLSSVIKKHGERNIEKNISIELEKAMEDWITEVYTLFGFPIYKKRIVPKK